MLIKKSNPQTRIMVGVPMTGLVRSEWMMARYGQVIPCNWGMADCLQFIDQYSPVSYSVADARNLIATQAAEQEFEWLFFVDHDVILPPGCILKWNERMHKADVPIFGGLYFSKGVPSEPLVYRGRGNSYFDKWRLGDEVWVDGLGLGCTMLHGSLLKVMYEESEEYNLFGKRIKRIFQTPAEMWFDPEKMAWGGAQGTEDLHFYSRIMEIGALKKAGWPKHAKKKYPFLVDTSVFCRHIDFNGIQYPSRGEENQFIKRK